MKYTIYGRPKCKFCDKAKELLEKFSIPYTYHDISTDALAKKKIVEEGHTTVPQIYFPTGEHLGDYTKLEDIMK